MNRCYNCGDNVDPQIKACRDCAKLLRNNKIGVFICAVFVVISLLILAESALFGARSIAFISAGIACAATFAGLSFLPSGNKNTRANQKSERPRNPKKERIYFIVGTVGCAFFIGLSSALMTSDSLSLMGNNFKDVKAQLIADNPAADLQSKTYTTNSLSLSSPSVIDISALSELESLEYLYLAGTSVNDIRALSGLTKLKNLDLLGVPVADLSALSELPALQRLTLYVTPVSDIAPLSGLTNLKFLNLSGTPVTDISALSDIKSLENLDLSELSISDISALSGLTGLKALDLSQTSVSDISGLSGLIALEWLDITFTSVSDISALSGLTNLKMLNLTGTSVDDFSAIQHLIDDGLVVNQ